jgi:hypothetical protein
VLFALVLEERRGKSSPAPALETRLDASPTTRSVSVPLATPSGVAGTTAASTVSQPPSAPAVRLVVNASRGDSWIVVRNGSATGELLFQETLVRGRSLRATGRVLWLRVGAGGNLDVRVNGRLMTLQAGTFNALLTQSGLQLVP